MGAALFHSLNQAQKLQIESMLLSIETSAESMSQYFTQRISEISFYSEHKDVRSMDFNKMRPFLMQQHGQHSDVYEKFIVGTKVGYFYNTAGGNPHQQMLRTFNDSDPQAKRKNIRKRDYWKTTVGENINNTNINYVSNPMISYTTGVKQVVVASSILDEDNNVTGLLGGSLPWKSVTSLIKRTQTQLMKYYPPSTRFMLLSKEGVYWYHWDQKRVIHLKTDQQGQSEVDAYGEKKSIISNILKEPNLALSNAGNRMVAGETGYAFLDLPEYNMEGYLFFAPVKAANYSIAALVSTDEINAPSIELAYYLGLSLVIALLFICMGIWWVTQKLSKPLASLCSNLSLQVSTGKLEELQTEGPKELQEISSLLNQLTQNLNTSQANLEISKQRFSLAMDAANDGLWDWDVKENTVYYSPRWKAIVGYRADELGNDIDVWLDLIHPDDQGRVEQLLNAYLEGFSNTYEVSFRMKHKEGHWVHILTKAIAVRDEEHSWPTRVVGIHTDVTRRMEAEEELKTLNQELESRISAQTKELTIANSELSTARDQALQSQKKSETANHAKSRFLANMSHEIRTPMNAILGLTELCLNSDLNTKQQKQLNNVRNSANSLLNLINDILDFSKIEAGELDINHISFDLPELMKEIKTLLDIHVAESSITLQLKLDGNIPKRLIGDPDRIRQIMINLGSNSAKFTHKGSITLEVKPTVMNQDNIELSFHVRDTGIGMTEDKLTTIFDAFKQADTSTTREYGGTGLGLSISQELVNMMGGRIQVESVLAKGSHFYFILPFAIDHSEHLPETLTDHSNENIEGKILLVEDTLINREIAAEMIKQLGRITVDVAENGLQAVEKAKITKYDLILMDIQMPVMDGIEATRNILESGLNQNTPIVALTANAMKEDQKRYKAEGMVDYLSKPFHMKDLHKILFHWL